jgi:hypothetical protein
MAQKIKTNLWPRLIAFTIDFSVIYGTAFVLLNLLQLFHIYIPIAKLTLIISILYFSVITIAFRTTIGKGLCGMSVESKSKLNYSITLLLREFVYKQLFLHCPIIYLNVLF